MAVIEIPREIDRFVLYFDTPQRQINSYALATSLIGLSDAVRVANAAVNPGYYVEVCSGQVISDTSIGFSAAISRS